VLPFNNSFSYIYAWASDQNKFKLTFADVVVFRFFTTIAKTSGPSGKLLYPPIAEFDNSFRLDRSISANPFGCPRVEKICSPGCAAVVVLVEICAKDGCEPNATVLTEFHVKEAASIFPGFKIP
jgi:hypothetical protein